MRCTALHPHRPGPTACALASPRRPLPPLPQPAPAGGYGDPSLFSWDAPCIIRHCSALRSFPTWGTSVEGWVKMDENQAPCFQCPADSLGFVCTFPVSYRHPTFQGEKSCFGCYGFSHCQPSCQHAVICISDLLGFPVPIAVVPLHGEGRGVCTTRKNKGEWGGEPASPGLWACNSSAAIRCLQNVAETLQGEKKKKIK